MNNQEFFRLFKDSRLAQVAKPLLKSLRGNTSGPSHQIIYTPKNSASRSNYGIKSSLPKQFGTSHIIFNNIDNKAGIPDIEKSSGNYYQRLRFQELGIPVNTETSENPLFPNKSNRTVKSVKPSNEKIELLSYAFNVKPHASIKDIKKILSKNPQLYKEFKQFLIKKYPNIVLSNSTFNIKQKVHEFLSSSNVKKANHQFLNDKSERIEGTGGFSYLLKGRVSNTPNGFKNGTIAHGRTVDLKEAAIGGFIANVTSQHGLQRNFTMNYPGKHQRQFVVPFKINSAEIGDNGKVKIDAQTILASKFANNENDDLSTYDADYSAASKNRAKDLQQFSSLLSIIQDPEEAKKDK